jgi:hypothetical protein
MFTLVPIPQLEFLTQSRQILPKLTKLKLDYTRSPDFDGSPLTLLSENLLKLEIEAPNLSNFDFIGSLTRLTFLYLHNCYKLTEKTPFISKLSNLLKLSIVGSWKINDSSMAQIATCSNLTSLRLLGLKSLTEKGVSKLATSCTNLRQLDLDRCGLKDRLGVGKILLHCTKLQYLSIPLATKVDDFDFACLRIGPPNKLEYVDLQGTCYFSH